MGTELQSLKKFPSIKLSISPSFNSIREDECVEEVDHRYTSLKDIIVHSPSWNSQIYEGCDYFDPSTIMIRNQLVKHAASAYVQSATILASRNQNCFVRFWERLRSKFSSVTCWHVYLWNPFQGCFWRAYCSIEYVVGAVFNKMIRV